MFIRKQIHLQVQKNDVTLESISWGPVVKGRKYTNGKGE